MKNNTRQVVILDNFSSPYIHQAILILKDYDPALEDKVIEEAEKIVSEYLKQPYCRKKQRNGFGWVFYSVCVIAIAAVILSYLL